MASLMHQSTSPCPPRPNTANPLPHERDRRLQEEKQVRYRQLVSRIMTQRLHSPTLAHIAQTHEATKPGNTVQAWEIRERCLSRVKAQAEAELLGVSWDQLTRDAERATRQIHVLSPTTYQAPLRMQRLEVDTGQEEQESGRAYTHVYVGCLERDVEWERKRAEMFALLKSAGEGRWQ